MPGTTKFESGPIRDPGRIGAWWIEGTQARRNGLVIGGLLLALGLALAGVGFVQTGAYGPFALVYVLFGIPVVIAGLVLCLSGTTPRREHVIDPLRPPAGFQLAANGLGVFAIDPAGAPRQVDGASRARKPTPYTPS